MNKLLSIIILILFSSSNLFAADTKGVITTIQPINSLVSAVIGDTGKTISLIPADISPHEYKLKPSDAKKMQEANIIFFVSNHLESSVTKVFKNLPKNIKIIDLLEETGIEHLAIRDNEAWERHDHHGHDDHDDHDDHGGLILSNYMQKDAEFNGYEFELGRSVSLNDGSMSFSYGMDYVNAKFKDGTYVPRINPRRHILSMSYAKDGTNASLTLRNVKSKTKLSLNETPTESYNMLDMKLSQRIPISYGDGEMIVTLFAKNLLDEVARNHSSFVKDEVPLPGRNIGLRFNMRF